jgi:hypothetical protein
MPRHGNRAAVVRLEASDGSAGGSLKVAPQGGECLLVEQLFAAWGVAIVALTVALSPMVYGDSAN